MHLTDLTCKRLRVTEKGRVTYPDDSLPGFGIRVSASGAKSFVLLVGRSRKRVTIGRLYFACAGKSHPALGMELDFGSLSGENNTY